jgi:hypothetical protein
MVMVGRRSTQLARARASASRHGHDPDHGWTPPKVAHVLDMMPQSQPLRAQRVRLAVPAVEVV